jgi:hypothetical protein
MFELFKSLFAAKTPVTLNDPELGLLTYGHGVWSGATRSGERDIHYYLSGDDAAPNATQLNAFRKILARFDDFEGRAVEFLVERTSGEDRSTAEFFREKRSTIEQRDFDFYAIDFLWEERPDEFAMEFLLDGDVDGVWRVEFKNGQPQ